MCPLELCPLGLQGGRTALALAAAQKDPEMCRLLIKGGANVDAVDEVSGWRV